jgi:hypothetical protein
MSRKLMPYFLNLKIYKKEVIFVVYDKNFDKIGIKRKNSW